MDLLQLKTLDRVHDRQNLCSQCVADKRSRMIPVYSNYDGTQLTKVQWVNNLPLN